MFDLIIPTVKPELRDSAVGSALRRSAEDVRLIVVDQTGNPAWPGLNYDGPVGWTAATNAGLALSSAPFVVLLNDDTEINTDGWLGKLADNFTDHPDLAGVGPVTNAPSYQGRYAGDGFEKLPVTKLHIDRWGGIGEFRLSFFCVMLRREAILDVGWFDPRLNDGYGGQEEDWMARAELRGWRFGVDPSVMVHHESSATYGDTRGELTEQNRVALRDKWRPFIDGQKEVRKGVAGTP